MQLDTIINIMITGFCLMIYTHISLIAYPFMTENLLIDIINKKVLLLENYLKNELGINLDNLIAQNINSEKHKISNSNYNTIKVSVNEMIDSFIDDINKDDNNRLKTNVKNIYKAIFPWAFISMMLFLVPLIHILIYHPNSFTKMHFIIITVATLTLLSEGYLYFYVFKKHIYKPNSLQEMLNICKKSAITY